MYCTKCGKQIDGSSKFCTSCGAPTAAQPKQAQTEIKAKATGKNKKKSGFFAELWSEMLDLLKHPKKLIPTFVLAAIWLIMPLVTGFAAGANIPAIRFFCTLTYANGGIFGGFLGTVGGIFGKAVFAAVINGIVLSLLEKKNPFKGLKKGIGGVFTGGLKAISPLLSGAGVGLILYWLFNITSAPQNSAVAVVAAIAAIQAIGKQNGLLFGGVFYLMKKLSKGKTPSRITVSRSLTGLAAGFSIGFGLTFLRYAWMPVLFGIILLGAGIGVHFVGKNGIKKAAATTALVLMLSGMLLPFIALPASAADSSTGYWKLTDVFENPDTPKRIYDDYNAGREYTISGSNGDYTYREVINGESLCAGEGLYHELHDCKGEYIEIRLSCSAPKEIYQAGEEVALYFRTELIDSSRYYCRDYDNYISAIIKYPNSQYTYDSLLNDNGDSGANIIKSASSYADEAYHLSQCTTCESFTARGNMPEDNELGNKVHIIVSTSSGYNNMPYAEVHYEYTWQTDASAVIEGSEDDYDDDDTGPLGSEKGDPNYVSYRGRLTYTSGITNKHGQPFPDIMDYNNDGYIDYTDLAIRQKLVHNPDYLDTPQGAALVAVTIITTVIGAGAGTAAGVIGSVAGTGSSLGGLNLNIEIPEDDEQEDLGRYITRDADGDLNVKDPATGKKRLYKSNGDGTYTNPLTGATYTANELKSSLDSRAENAANIRQDEKSRQEWLDAERERSKELSDLGKQVAESDKAFKEQAAREDRIVEIGEKHGIYSADADEVKKHILQDRNKEYLKQAEYEATAEYAEAGEKTAARIEKTADVLIDIGAEIDTTGTGEVIKNAYVAGKAVGKNTMEVALGNKTVAQGVASAAFEGANELIKNKADGVVMSGVANVAGDGINATAQSLIDGDDLETARQKGSDAAIQGAVNFAIDTAGDAIGDAVTDKLGDYADNEIAKVFGEDITTGSVADISKTAAKDLGKMAASDDSEN